MTYKPPCTEEQFNRAVNQLALNEKSEEWANLLAEMEFGNCQSRTPEMKEILDNAVDLGLMTKNNFGTLPPVYRVIHTTQQLRA